MSNNSATQVYLDEINSLPAAVVFAALYLVFLAGFIFQWVKFRSRTYHMLWLFCVVRLTSFILRAIIAGSDNVHVGLLIGEEITFSIGVFPLLNAVHNVIFDRWKFYSANSSTTVSPKSKIPWVLRGLTFYRILILLAVVVGSVGLSQVYDTDNASVTSTGGSLHLTSMVIFLVLVLYLASLVVMLIRGEARGHKFQQSTSNARFGAQNGGFVLLGISLLLLIRQAYSTATASDRSRANNEHLWYPLIALPEILIVMLFYIPDLIPRRFELICGEEAAMSVKPGNLYSEPTPLPSARVESRLRSKTISRQGPPPFTPSTPQLPPDHDLVADSKIEQEQNGSMDRAPSVPLERTPSRLT